MTDQQPASRFQFPVAGSGAAFFAPIQREFDRLFDQLGAARAAFPELPVVPRMDVRETKDGVEVTMEVPGIAEADVKVTVDQNVLTVSGEKKSESEKTEGDLRVSERSYGSFSRTVTLPSNVEGEKLTASLKDGVLTIVAPKDGKSAPKTITVKAAH